MFERRGARTVLAAQYAAAPLRVGPPFSFGDAAHLICVCTGPGVFAGDTLRQAVHVKSGARVVLTSQSALQVHPSRAGAPARIEHAYRVDADAELHCHWDPTIPFAHARVEQRFEIDIAHGGRLYWSDALMAGRASHGEEWQFEHLRHELRCRIGGALTYLERFALRPRDHVRPPTRAWIAGRDRYFSTTAIAHPDAAAAHADALQGLLGVGSGVDVVADGVLLVRISSPGGTEFRRARQIVRGFAASSIFQRPSLANRR